MISKLLVGDFLPAILEETERAKGWLRYMQCSHKNQSSLAMIMARVCGSCFSRLAQRRALMWLDQHRMSSLQLSCRSKILIG